MSNPTAAAMRATKCLFGSQRDDQTQIADADLIDCETGLPELIAACEAALKSLGKLSSVEDVEAGDMVFEALRIAREGRS